MGKQIDMFDAFDTAKAYMDRRFVAGAQQESALMDIVTKTMIYDRLVPPSAMGFLIDPQEKKLRLRYDDGTLVGIHAHALNQLCQKVRIPLEFARELAGGDARQQDVIVYALEGLFSRPVWKEYGGQPARFLHRIVDGELRGFLSRRFNRNLASAPLLRAFIDQCAIEGAKAVEATSSPVRNALKCLMPKVFEAFPGEHVAVGVEWSNSDFGSGKLKVLQTVWRISTSTAAVLDEGLMRAHIGSVIEDSDIEVSDETAKKEVEAQQGAIKDHVKGFLAEKTIERLLEGIRIAHEEQIPWTQIKGRLQQILGKENTDWLQNILDGKGESIIDLPPISFAPDGSRMPNRYWLANGISAVAAKTEDPDRRMDLQREAGRLLAAILEKG